MKTGAKLGDLDSFLDLRWLRCVVCHLLCSCFFLTLWACLTWSRAGLFDFLSSSLAPLPPLFVLLFLFSQLAFVCSLRLVCEPACTPSVSAVEFASWVSLRLWLGALGGKLDKVGQVEAEITATRVRETGKRALLLLSFSANGAIGILALSGLQPYIVQSCTASCGFGALLGLVYGANWLRRRDWVVSFPIIQRRFLLRFKLGVFANVARAFQLAVLLPLSCLLAPVFWTNAGASARWRHCFHLYLHHFLVTILVGLCWNTATYLVRVIQSERHIFAPPDSDPLPTSRLLPALTVGPTSSRLSFLRHLAFLDLCHLAEDKGSSWRRAALFEETGRCYDAAIKAVVGPVNALTLRLTRTLHQSEREWETTSVQMMDPNAPRRTAHNASLFQDYQLCMWCIRSAAALTSSSKVEDRFGVAQLTASNSLVVSALLSSLLALESWMKRADADERIRRGRRGRSTIRNLASWVSMGASSSNQEAARGLGDGLRVGMYRIVATFGGEMVRGGEGGVGMVGEEWVGREKSSFGSRQQLVDKLKSFLLYEA